MTQMSMFGQPNELPEKPAGDLRGSKSRSLALTSGLTRPVHIR